MNAHQEIRRISGMLLFFAPLLISCSILFAAHAQEQPQEQKIVKIQIPPPVSISAQRLDIPAFPRLQVSDISILTSSRNLILRVELARNDNERRFGLMFRDNIPIGSGMLFVFDTMQERTFWMKNTWVPLDILFVREDGVIHSIHHKAIPRSLERIASNGESQYVLEIKGGEAERLGIASGDKILLR